MLQALAQLVKRADVLFRESPLGEESLRSRHVTGDAIFLLDVFCCAVFFCVAKSWEEEQRSRVGALEVECGPSFLLQPRALENLTSLFFLVHESQATTTCYTNAFTSTMKVPAESVDVVSRQQSAFLSAPRYQTTTNLGEHAPLVHLHFMSRPSES